MVTQASGDHTDRDVDVQEVIQLATERLKQGLAPPRELYLIQHRTRMRWSESPAWARPSDPEMFDGCCHEG